MSDNGYKDFIRGEKGSTAEHLSDMEFKAKKEREKLEAITDKIKQQQTKFAADLDVNLKLSIYKLCLFCCAAVVFGVFTYNSDKNC